MSPHVIPVKSRTTDDTHYVTVSDDWKSYRCTCTGFSIRGRCYHGDKELLKRDGVVVEEIPSTLPHTPLPMLAKKLDAKVRIRPGSHVAEIKYDGFRTMVHVMGGNVRAWSRTGNDALHRMPKAMIVELQQLPDGYYDGELVLPGEGTYSSDVATKSNMSKLKIVLFDVLRLLGRDLITWRQEDRRKQLELIFSKMSFNYLEIAQSWKLESLEHLNSITDFLWEQGIEGVIVKDTSAPYTPGRDGKESRTRAFLKVKELNDDNMQIIGFCPSEGEVLELGDFGTVVVVDQKGVICCMKVKNSEIRKQLENCDHNHPTRTWKEVKLLSGKKIRFFTNHAWVGKILNVEYQRKTPDGSYRHPRWHMIVE